jgi:hypothetical protein
VIVILGWTIYLEGSKGLFIIVDMASWVANGQSVLSLMRNLNISNLQGVEGYQVMLLLELLKDCLGCERYT